MPEFHAVALAPKLSSLAAPLMIVAGWAFIVVAALATWFAFM